uniref:PDZ domain-containing protein n=1 Tax=Poecilia latipinna TaxID=48699 RepID=A0A3B3UHB9_9TELE
MQGELLCVDLEKDQQGLGLSLAGNRDRSRLSIFVVGLHPGGPASRDGRIRVGDELLEVRRRQPMDSNASAIIKTAAETVLEICKGRSGLGLSIVGGTDTQLVTPSSNAIVIHEVYEEGAAARDGRLWAGDQILEVNGVDLRGASHEEAIAALRQTPAKVRLTVLRDEARSDITSCSESSSGGNRRRF